MHPTREAPPLGEQFVRYVINVVRFITAAMIAGVSIATVIVSGLTGHVGGIIASIYIIPAAFVLLALEFAFLRRLMSSRFSVLKQSMHPTRIIALQFFGAMLAGVNWPNIALFILGCVCLGLGIGLMNLVGIYHLFWHRRTGEGNGSDAWSLETEQWSKGRLLLVNNSEEEVLFTAGRDVCEDEESSIGSGPVILSTD
ncbi:hypothetical protein BDV93DRAFT_320123 [Ceratobasidium sp. AG-I]|nr:hypothetical protein BDV93DRAFT_320123 [Ceratobasidium sp. AG-I]